MLKLNRCQTVFLKRLLRSFLEVVVTNYRVESPLYSLGELFFFFLLEVLLENIHILAKILSHLHPQGMLFR